MTATESYTIELLHGMDGLWGYRIVRTHVIDKETRMTDTIAFSYSVALSEKIALEEATAVLNEWNWKQ